MRKLITFNFITLDGYYKGPADDISWNKHSREENEYAEEGAQSDSILVFGRVTYEMMAGYWPSSHALQNNKVVAEGMNKAEKIVFSKTLSKADWNNSRVLKGNPVDEIKNLKQTPGKNMTILGSGSIITQLADHGLIDEYQVMINPLALGSGTPLFSGIKRQLNLKLTKTQPFKGGTVLLCYQPV